MSSAKELIFNATDEDDREPFFITMYNNTLIRSRPCLYHDNGPYSYKISSSNKTPAKPYFYFYNNIVDSVGAEKEGRNDLNILFSYSSWDVGDIDMATVFVENNLFVERASTDDIINVGDDSDDYSAVSFESNDYATTVYAKKDKTGLYSTGYKHKWDLCHRKQ